MYIAQNLTSAATKKELCRKIEENECGGLKVGVVVISSIARVMLVDMACFILSLFRQKSLNTEIIVLFISFVICSRILL
jgi:hypothetical protein